jgi:hypothetical protein
MEVLGYKYDTEQEAINAREACDAYYGIPVSPNDVTQNWVEYQKTDLNNPNFWYIIYNDSLNVVLGTPETFDVETPPFPPIN